MDAHEVYASDPKNSCSVMKLILDHSSTFINLSALMDVALQRKGSFLPCSKCFGWKAKPDPRCRYGCDKWMTFPPTKASPTTDPVSEPTIEPEQTEAQLEDGTP